MRSTHFIYSILNQWWPSTAKCLQWANSKFYM